MNIGHDLTIRYEKLPNEDRLMRESAGRIWLAAVAKVVLKFNEIGLLSRLRFGKK